MADAGRGMNLSTDAAVVAVNGQTCEFGACLRSLLLLSDRTTAVTEDQVLYVKVELTQSKTLNLTLDASTTGIALEHAAYCPAHEFASPRADGHIRVGVATVLEKNGSVLLTRRHAQLRSFPDVWVVPGGHIEANETLQDTAKRELFEETGLRNGIHCIDGLLGVWESCFPHRASLGRMTHHHAVCYMHAIVSGCETEEELHVQSSEVQSVAWVNRAQVQAILNVDDKVAIDVLEADAASSFTHPDVVGQDAWHGDRALVSRHAKLETAAWFADNMTAGTRFALRLWLERSSKATL